MASNIKRPIQIFNGTDWDKILLETSEDQIKSGFAQNLAASGYKKLPGGLIIQWGAWRSDSGVMDAANGLYNYTYTFPIAFPNSVFQVIATTRFDAGGPIATVVNQSNANAKMAINVGIASAWVHFIAIGY